MNANMKVKAMKTNGKETRSTRCNHCPQRRVPASTASSPTSNPRKTNSASVNVRVRGSSTRIDNPSENKNRARPGMATKMNIAFAIDPEPPLFTIWI
jgi:hypothetical protein